MMLQRGLAPGFLLDRLLGHALQLCPLPFLRGTSDPCCSHVFDLSLMSSSSCLDSAVGPECLRAVHGAADGPCNQCLALPTALRPGGCSLLGRMVLLLGSSLLYPRISLRGQLTLDLTFLQKQIQKLSICIDSTIPWTFLGPHGKGCPAAMFPFCNRAVLMQVSVFLQASGHSRLHSPVLPCENNAVRCSSGLTAPPSLAKGPTASQRPFGFIFFGSQI